MSFLSAVQARSQHFTLGVGHRSCEGALFFSEKVDDLFLVVALKICAGSIFLP